VDTSKRALSRFGLGARIGEPERIGDARQWLRAQLERPQPTLAGTELGEIAVVLRDLRRAQRARDRERLMAIQRRTREIQSSELNSMLSARITSDTPYVERLVAFWSNHLCVSVVASRQIAALAGHYERTVIRPHVLGNFTDMVMASAKHPAMLFYLDNVQSMGPGSDAAQRGRRGGRAQGLNENYARELMELHTLGVEAGYTQQDVEQLARILTGWTTSSAGPGSRRDGPLGFIFRPFVHEPGQKTVLGKRYPEDGIGEGEQAIRDLCAHPATAHFVAGKLVQHFVSDGPPPGAVEEIAGVFTDTGGDLAAVSLALIDLEEAWSPDSKKFRTPQDWLVAVFRAVRAQEAPEQMPQLLRQLRHAPWGPTAPKGYGDMRREWADPDSLMNRAELARSLARRWGRSGLEPTRLLDVVDVPQGDPLRKLLADRNVPAPERFALAIGGPAFQWR